MFVLTFFNKRVCVYSC